MTFNLTRDAAPDHAHTRPAPAGDVEICNLEPLLGVRALGVQGEEPDVAEPGAAAVPADHHHAPPAPVLHQGTAVLGPDRLEVGQAAPLTRHQVQALDQLEGANTPGDDDVAPGVPDGAVRGPGAGQTHPDLPGVPVRVIHLGACRVARQGPQGAAHHVQLALLRRPSCRVTGN